MIGEIFHGALIEVDERSDFIGLDLKDNFYGGWKSIVLTENQREHKHISLKLGISYNHEINA